jgi:hypothetical protein
MILHVNACYCGLEQLDGNRMRKHVSQVIESML